MTEIERDAALAQYLKVVGEEGDVSIAVVITEDQVVTQLPGMRDSD